MSDELKPCPNRGGGRLMIRIRWMIRRDMIEVVEIDRQSFASRWGEPVFLETLRQRNVIGMVAEDRDRVVGFMVFRLHRDRIELLRLAVSADRQREGIGERLVGKLKGKLSPFRPDREVVACDLDEPEATIEACRFLASQGFASRLVRDGEPHVYRFAFSHLDEAALLGPGEGSCSTRP